MTQPIRSLADSRLPRSMPSVERRTRIRNALYDAIVALTGADKKTRQLHKDIHQSKNKAPDSLALMVDAALSRGEHSKVRAIAHYLLALCSAGKARVFRKFSQIFCAETANQGELDNVELAIEQGDRSPQTLDHLIQELDEDITIKTEMKEWAIHERHIANVAQGGR